MVYSKATAKATADEWQALGFYYESDDATKVWRFVGSREGLWNVVNILDKYSSNLANTTNSEHQHYGPYMYLKITTASFFEVGKDGFRGTVDYFRDLSRQIAERLRSAEANTSFVLIPTQSNASDYRLVFDVRQDDFAPAFADPQLGLTEGANGDVSKRGRSR